MEGKAGDLVSKVDGDGLAVLDVLAVHVELDAALAQVVDGAVNVVGQDGDVAVGAAARLLHDLEFLLAHEDAAVADLDGHAQQVGDGLGSLGSLGLVSAVDADVAQLQAQHNVNGLTAHSGDLVPGTGLDLVALAHPGAADGDDLVVAQVVVDVLGVDAAGAHPLAGLEGSADVLQLVHAAVGLGREELDDLAAHVHGLLHLACGGGAGHHDAALVDDVLADLGVKAGGNDEGSTGSHSAVSLILGQDSAGAQQHIGQLLMDLLDAILGAGGAEGDLRSRQAAGHQGLAQGQGLIHAVESNDRNNADLVNTLQNRIHSNSPSLIVCGSPAQYAQ